MDEMFSLHADEKDGAKAPLRSLILTRLQPWPNPGPSPSPSPSPNSIMGPAPAPIPHFNSLPAQPSPSISRAHPLIATLQALGRKKFSRFYAEVLFRHFDADNSNTRVPPVKRLVGSGHGGRR